MDPLAFIEILGRDGEVAARHPVHRWPATAGRGYSADVIIDDPFVAPLHVRIEPAAYGRFRVDDLQSVNGIALLPSEQRVAAAEAGPDDVVRLGRTQIRIRAASYAVRPEQTLRAVSYYRRPLAFVTVAATLLAITVWNGWIMTTTREERAFLVFPALMVCTGVGVWISVWSLVGRTVGGRANFAAHGFVACAALAALALSDVLFEYLSFGFSASWPGYLGTAATVAVFAYMIYRHLRLNSRAPRRRLGIISIAVSLAAYGTVAGIEMAGESGREGAQRYSETLKPPAFLWVRGVAPEAFLADAGRMKRKVDALVGGE
jgi:hypothetical protein